MVETSTFEPGRMLDDRVEIIGVIGQGAMGSVYKARQYGVERAVAVKALHQSCLSEKDSVARFFREAKLVSTLDHPNIVRVYAVGIADQKYPYFVMDYIEGQTLADLIEQNKISAAQYIDIFMQVALALQHAHGKGVVHRDIKPRNILLVDDDGKLVVKLVDFGIARTDQLDGSGQRITKTGAIIGSPTYMSPEQCTGKKVDVRSDIYSLGCVMYEAACGSVPFKDTDAVGLIGKHVMEQPKSLSSLVHIPKFPTNLFDVVSICMQKSPEGRYQTAESLYRDLKAVSENDCPPGVFAALEAASKKTPIGRYRLQIIALLMVSSVLLVGIFYWLRHDADQTNERNRAMAKAGELCDRAIMCRRSGLFEHALSLYTSAYECYLSTGIQDQRLVDICAGRAQCESTSGAYAAANKFYLQAINIEEQIAPENTVMLAALHKSWGESFMRQTSYFEAADHLMITYKAWKAMPVSDDLRIPLYKELIASLVHGESYETALKIYPELIAAQKRWGAENDHMASTIGGYANALQKAHHEADAAVQRRIASEFEKKAAAEN